MRCPAENSVVGDGENDLEMVAHVGLGTAIGRLRPGLVALADRTVPPPNRGGIAAIFTELGSALGIAGALPATPSAEVDGWSGTVSSPSADTS